MFREALKRAIDDVFEHLGFEVLYGTRDGAKIAIIAVVKEPENPYEIGDSKLVQQVAEVSVKSADVTPRVGDFIFSNGKKYKIYEEPLLDASNYMWRFHAVLEE